MDINYGTTELRKLEKHYAREVLRRLDGNKTQASRLLGISRPKLDTLLKDQWIFSWKIAWLQACKSLKNSENLKYLKKFRMEFLNKTCK